MRLRDHGVHHFYKHVAATQLGIALRYGFERRRPGLFVETCISPGY